MYQVEHPEIGTIGMLEMQERIGSKHHIPVISLSAVKAVHTCCLVIFYHIFGMVVIQFKQHHDAVVFIEEFNGRPFNSVEVR